jgi:Ca2+-transporting ATPase
VTSQRGIAELTELEAARRLREHGPNLSPQPPPRSLATRVLEQLRDPMILLLLVAGTVTTLTGDHPDTAIIAAVVVLNTTLGVLQERRAEQAMRALDRLAAPFAVVHRDGTSRRVPAAEVVPGDLVLLGAGDVVPADATLVEAHGLELDESAITGESLPRAREVGEQVEAGTVVTRGRARAAVTRTGADSGLGRIAALVATTPVRSTPLQRRLTRLSTQLVGAVLVLAGVVLVIGLVNGRSLGEMTVVALSLSVAAVPESLPAVVSVALALGAARMAARHAIVRRLPAVETLGSVTVLASDKTGTLTEGRMRLAGLWVPGQETAVVPRGEAAYDEAAYGGAAYRRLLEDLVLCSDAQSGSTLDQASLARAGELGVPVEQLRQSWVRLQERPFDAAVRTMATLQRRGDSRRLVVKGAPEAVLRRLRPDHPDVEAVVTAAAAAGHRVLLVAEREAGRSAPQGVPVLDDAGLRLVGMAVFADPLRSTAPDVVRSLERAGIRLALVTGDHAATAATIASRLGITRRSPDVVDGDAQGRSLEEELAGEDVHRVGVFARIRPEQKVAVVRRLQAAGEVVAMTGDGVNDAPVLRAADIGVAKGGSGTEVARQAADLVLADDNLDTVVAAVEEGRRIYANIRTFLRYGLAGGLAEVVVMLVGPFVGMPLPLLPAQSLWINMLTHGLPGVAFGAEPVDPSVRVRPPGSPQEAILGGRLLRAVAVTGAMIAGCAAAAGLWADARGAHVQTAVFLTLGLAQLSVAWALRSPGPRPWPRGRGVEISVLGAAALQLAAVYVPWLNELLGTRPPQLDALLAPVLLAAVPGLLVWLGRARS